MGEREEVTKQTLSEKWKKECGRQKERERIDEKEHETQKKPYLIRGKKRVNERQTEIKK